MIDVQQRESEKCHEGDVQQQIALMFSFFCFKLKLYNLLIYSALTFASFSF